MAITPTTPETINVTRNQYWLAHLVIASPVDGGVKPTSEANGFAVLQGYDNTTGALAGSPIRVPLRQLVAKAGSDQTVAAALAAVFAAVDKLAKEQGLI